MFLMNLKKLKCVAYELNGKNIDYFPAAVENQLKIKPIYKTFPGWKKKTPKELKNLKTFLKSKDLCLCL